LHLLRVRDIVRRAAAGGGATLRKLIALELTNEQHLAVDAPYDGCFAILGSAGTGKSTALNDRIARAGALAPHAEPLIVRSPRDLDQYAANLLNSNGVTATLVDDVDGELIFAEAAAPLFSLQWEEFAQQQLDPEVPGLRSPERFLQSAFRLIRRLRDAAVEPSGFLAAALTGATEFYANPPNLADPALLFATKTVYHDSLDANPRELQRQYRREIDLAKILAKLYERYVERLASTGRFTGRDAVIAAAERLRRDAALAGELRKRHRYAFIDDAQGLTKAHLQLLGVIFGERLAGVTLCGDPASAISTLHMTDPAATFGYAQSSVELTQRYLAPRREVGRVSTPREEAELIAERVAAWLVEGYRPENIAVLFRSVRNVTIYERALLERDVPVVVAGDFNVFTDRRALDALALLWNVYDPFRHDWLLRTLGNPAFGLSDASLALLCAEPPDPQRPLFAFDEEPAPTTRASRWNPKRDLRLGWNVIRGEQDNALEPDAAARVQRFRRLRQGWLETMERASFEQFARSVWRDALAREGAPGSARARAQQVTLQRLLDRLSAFADRKEDATIADVLEYAEQRMKSDLETCEPDAETVGFVQMLSIDAARGREFDRAIVANVHPGAFPLWYSPEAFLFSPRLGMIPKENVGDAHASRTAKFSYYMVRTKAAKHYYERERRAFAYAMSRARESVLVTASGRPTRGVTVPEFLEELR
jgi:superfamily I DNA/RNA helicase